MRWVREAEKHLVGRNQITNSNLRLSEKRKKFCFAKVI